MTEKVEKKNGGARPGSGRPKIANTEKVTLLINSHNLAALKKHDNWAAEARLILAKHFNQCPNCGKTIAWGFAKSSDPRFRTMVRFGCFYGGKKDCHTVLAINKEQAQQDYWAFIKEINGI